MLVKQRKRYNYFRSSKLKFTKTLKLCRGVPKKVFSIRMQSLLGNSKDFRIENYVSEQRLTYFRCNFFSISNSMFTNFREKFT